MSTTRRSSLARAAGAAAAVLAVAAAVAIAPAARGQAPGAAVESPPATSAPVSAPPAEKERAMPSPGAPVTREGASPESPPPLPAEVDGEEEFAPITEERLEDDAAEELVEESITLPETDVVPEVDDLKTLLADVAAGAYRVELEAQWLELEANGWSYAGESRVVEVEILALDERTEPASAEVSACVDSGDVVLLDADGEPVGSSGDAPSRAKHLFTLLREDGTWRVTARTFPDDPAC